MTGTGWVVGVTRVAGLPAPIAYLIALAVLVVAVLIAAAVGRRSGRRALSQRLTALGSRLGLDAPREEGGIEHALSYLEQVTSAASEAVAESSSDAIRLRRSLDTLPQGVVLCDETGSVVYRNARANALMTSRHGDALAAQAVTELVEDAWHEGAAERTLDLYGPPRRTLTVRARLIDDGRRPLGVIALIEDVSERRRLEEIRRDFVANVSHELKTPMGALGLLAETLVAEPDGEVAKRLASRIQTEAFRVSRIIDDLLDLSRLESEEAPPREPVLVSLVMAEAVERVRATADQRGIRIEMDEPPRPVAVLGDRRQLVSAMHALLENAVTYSYDASVVRVAGTIQRESLVFSGAPSGVVEVANGAAGVGVSAAAGIGVAGGTASFPGPGGAAPRSPGGGGPAGPPGAGTGAGRAPGGAGDPPADSAPTGPHPVGGAHLPGPRNGPGTHPTPGGPPNAAAGGGFATNGAFTGPPSVGSTAVGPAIDPATGTHFLHDLERFGERETVRIAVIDHGIGIPARDLDRIFERFYRVDHGRSRDTGGTGLGLSIVRHVANNHQGWVDVESREGEGSTFTLVLPLQPDRSA
ncbi:MAG TPA: ATP-binding protein [Acidimicrobiales bacterium]